MQAVQSISKWRDYWDRFEAAVGLIAAFGLAFGPLTWAALTLIFALLLAEWSVAAIAAIVTAVTCPMAFWLARMAETALGQFRLRQIQLTESPAEDADSRRTSSFAVLMASTLPPLPWIARLPLAAWWLGHFLAATALVEFGDVLAQQGLLWSGLTIGVPAVVFSYLFHFAANIFLVLAVAALLGSPNVTIGIWRKRFAIDAAVVLPLLIRVVI